MARGGIYKSEVIRAREKLLAVGRYPSIDAVRQELGNTGSKATIHRYLKEIEEEEGGKTGSKVAISEALQDLVARLAERLNMEADARIADLTAKHTAELSEHRQAHEAVQARSSELAEGIGKGPGGPNRRASAAPAHSRSVAAGDHHPCHVHPAGNRPRG